MFNKVSNKNKKKNKKNKMLSWNKYQKIIQCYLSGYLFSPSTKLSTSIFFI